MPKKRKAPQKATIPRKKRKKDLRISDKDNIGTGYIKIRIKLTKKENRAMFLMVKHAKSKNYQTHMATHSPSYQLLNILKVLGYVPKNLDFLFIQRMSGPLEPYTEKIFDLVETINTNIQYYFPDWLQKGMNEPFVLDDESDLINAYKNIKQQIKDEEGPEPINWKYDEKFDDDLYEDEDEELKQLQYDDYNDENNPNLCNVRDVVMNEQYQNDENNMNLHNINLHNVGYMSQDSDDIYHSLPSQISSQISYKKRIGALHKKNHLYKQKIDELAFDKANLEKQLKATEKKVQRKEKQIQNINKTPNNIFLLIKNNLNNEEAGNLINKISTAFPGSSAKLLAKHQQIMDKKNKKQIKFERYSWRYKIKQSIQLYQHNINRRQVQSMRNIVNNEVVTINSNGMKKMQYLS